MSNNIKISVIVPFKNREKTLKSCINSIIKQTYSDFELILVDDHSTDKSLEIVKKYVNEDSRIKVFKVSEGRCGAQAARNIGIENSKNEWIAFLDSDDEWLDIYLETQIKELKRHNCNLRYVGYCDCYRLDENERHKNKKINDSKHWKLPHISGKKSYKDLLGKSGPMFQGLICSRKLLNKINLLDETVVSYQEWDTSIRLAKDGGVFNHIKKPLFIYYIGRNDSISSSISKDIIGKHNILYKYREDIIKYYGKRFYSKKYLLLYSFFVKNVKHINNWVDDRELLNALDYILCNF